jgi:hypothetical protein
MGAPQNGYIPIMSSQSLTHRAPAAGIEPLRLTQFATAMARRDRSRHREWLRDDDLERAIRGYAYAAAIAEHRVLALGDGDVARAISAYRRARRLPKRTEPTQRSLIGILA